MLALRLMRGGRPDVQLRRLLVSAASAGTGFLLLCALGHALQGGPGGAVRLAWCLVPLVATVYVAVAVARTDPALRPDRSGLAAFGLEGTGLRVFAGVATAAFCGLGSVVALLAFLFARGNLVGQPLGHGAAKALGAMYSLPLAGIVTLLAIVPVIASVSAALAAPVGARGRGAEDGRTSDTPVPPATPPAGLPWGIALLTAGLAVQTYAGRGVERRGTAWLDGAGGSLAGTLTGWVLTALGLAVAGPGLTYLCGRLLQSAHPGAVRLLAGRGLQEEARRIGRPVGVVCAVAAALLAALRLDGAAPSRQGDAAPGLLTVFGVTLVAACAGAALLLAAVESRQARHETTATLQRAGAPVATLRSAVAVRAGALLLVLAPLAWVVAVLATLPLAG
ncbi:hypothetical protein AB0J21_31655 [Streptomyces sp. NPDC049954]|uniref:hypothetical protein n=1 Tax=Streptomyces sp. NPDC049954 TaxID=3155779 RepID=UPI0034326F21